MSYGQERNELCRHISKCENANTQGTSEELQDPETPYTNTFIDTFAARTAIGHDVEGRLMILQIDGLHGRNWPYRGIDLHNLANLLIKLGFQNAINLSWRRQQHLWWRIGWPIYPLTFALRTSRATTQFVAERPVSSIVCVHDAVPPSSESTTSRPEAPSPVPMTFQVTC